MLVASPYIIWFGCKGPNQLGLYDKRTCLRLSTHITTQELFSKNRSLVKRQKYFFSFLFLITIRNTMMCKYSPESKV